MTNGTRFVMELLGCWIGNEAFSYPIGSWLVFNLSNRPAALGLQTIRTYRLGPIRALDRAFIKRVIGDLRCEV